MKDFFTLLYKGSKYTIIDGVRCYKAGVAALVKQCGKIDS